MKYDDYPYCELKVLRQNRNLTQQQLADKLGIKAASVAMIENNKRGASLTLIMQLLDVLDCNFRDLYPAGKVVKRPDKTLGGDDAQLLII